jgi:hypothetical protein
MTVFNYEHESKVTVVVIYGIGITMSLLAENFIWSRSLHNVIVIMNFDILIYVHRYIPTPQV